MTYAALKLLIGIILLSPGWIWMISTKSWRALTKKVLISMLAIISIGVAIYGLVRPQVSSTSLSWFGHVVLVIYLASIVVSTYYYWPRGSR